MTRSLPRQLLWCLCLVAFCRADVSGFAENCALLTLSPGTAAGTQSYRRLYMNSVGRSKQLPWRRQGRDSDIILPALHEPAAAATAADSAASTTKSTDIVVEIKPATFPELGAVSRLLVEEFYGSGLWFPAQCLVELRRLQDNFHSYEEDATLHLMLVATAIEDGSLAGFVDVDGRDRRASNGRYRPYLSDLAVARRFRRLGVGTELVRACEDACVSWGFESLYLKVHAGNVAAERLYHNLGYVEHAPKNDKNEVTLRGSPLAERSRAAPSGSKTGDEVMDE